MGSGYSWHPEATERAVKDWAIKGLTAACIVVENHAKKLVSVPGTSARKGTGSSGRRARRGRVYGARRSAPGQPPLKQYGHLRRSLTHEVDRMGLVGRVGSNLKVARWLELGTRRIQPRPFLRRSLAECLSQVRRILTRPI
jgi:hypothetical protein